MECLFRIFKLESSQTPRCALEEEKAVLYPIVNVKNRLGGTQGQKEQEAPGTSTVLMLETCVLFLALLLTNWLWDLEEISSFF